MYNNTQQRFFQVWNWAFKPSETCVPAVCQDSSASRECLFSGISNKVSVPLTHTHTRAQHLSFCRLDEWQRQSGSEHQDSDAEGWLGAPLRVRSCDWAMSAKALWIFSSSISPRKTTSSRRAAASWFSSSSCRRLAAWQQICLLAEMATGSGQFLIVVQKIRQLLFFKGLRTHRHKPRMLREQTVESLYHGLPSWI